MSLDFTCYSHRLSIFAAALFALALPACDSAKDKIAFSAEQTQEAKERTRPVGQVHVGNPPPLTSAKPDAGPPAVASNSDPGEKTYKAVCVACHEAGVAGAPKSTDKAAWAARAKQGIETLYTHAIAGFQGKAGMMPAKGGATTLNDDDVKAAVRYILKTSGNPVSTDATSAPQASTPTRGKGDPPAGKAVFDKACTACHSAGLAGAPKVGDTRAWAPRIAQGTDTLVKHAIEGFSGKAGVMPPRGGFSDLSDADVRNAVEYMVDKSK